MAIKRRRNGSYRINGGHASILIDVLKVQLFNSEYSVGDRIKVRLDDGSVITDTITNPASILGGHTPVVWLKSKACYRLDRILGKEVGNG